jgi:AcrR family transcriptional regulator/predicted DNA-binding transcriptional regulator AlpA
MLGITMKVTYEKPLRISDLERITGLSRRTIHFYIKEGLLSPPQRTGKTMAYYSVEHVKELDEVRRLREQGYPISSIREMTKNMERSTLAANTGEDNKADKQARKQKLIEAAVEIFSRKGYSGTKISDITSAVGVGQSTFYLYFPSKKSIFMECIDGVFNILFDNAWRDVKDVEDPLRQLRKQGEITIKHYPQIFDFLQLLRMTMDDDPHLKARRKELYEAILEPVKRDLQKAVEMGLIEPVNIEIASYLLLGLIETTSLLLNLDNRFSVEEILDVMESILIPGRGSRH